MHHVLFERWARRPGSRGAPLRLLMLQAVVGVTVAFAACTSGQEKPLPLPLVLFTTTTSTTPQTVLFSTVDLTPVPGRTTLLVGFRPGTAKLGGVVTGPDGPVPGATVHVERIVDDVIGSEDVTSASDGTWAMPGVLGGQYRIRAWRRPDLSQSQPDILFLGGKESRNETLTVDRAPGNEIAFAVAPRTPLVGIPVQVALGVTMGSVDGNGVVRVLPRQGVSVQLVIAGHWTSASPTTQNTRGDGSVRWNLTCTETGAQGLSVLVNNVDVFPLGVPPCAPAPAPVTAAPTTKTTKAAVSTTVAP